MTEEEAEDDGSRGDDDVSGEEWVRSEPRFYDVADPHLVTLPARLARVLTRVHKKQIAIDLVPELPKPVRVTWGKHVLTANEHTSFRMKIEADWILLLDIVCLDRESWMPVILDARGSVKGPVQVELEDGRVIHARWLAGYNISTSIDVTEGERREVLTLRLRTWTLPPTEPTSTWACPHPRLGFFQYNLVLHPVEGGFYSGCIRLESEHLAINILDASDAKQVGAIVVDTLRKDLDLDRLGLAIRAASIAMGRTILVPRLVAVTPDGRAVGFASTGFIETAASSIVRPPVPPKGAYCYTAEFHRKLLARLDDEDSKDMMLRVTAVMMDSLSMRYETAHLVLQVILEAFCKYVTKKLPKSKTTPMVWSRAWWEAFIEFHRDTIAGLSTNAETARILLKKMKSSLLDPPSSRTVPDTLAKLGYTAPADFLEAAAKRNDAAHSFRIFSKSEGTLAQELHIIEQVRTILLVVLSHFIGYQGPLRDPTCKEYVNVRELAWWPSSGDPAGRRWFVAEMRPQFVAEA